MLGGIHALGAHSDIRAYEPLREWAVFLIVVGGLAWISALMKAFGKAGAGVFPDAAVTAAEVRTQFGVV